MRDAAIYGLLGRNGAGKTTLMQIMTGQNVASGGRGRVFDADPHENDAVLSQLCLIREGHRYPDAYTVQHASRAGKLLFPQWSDQFAESLVDDFRAARERRVKKLSRGMVSALGIVNGLASRSRLTLFDEPYLGLDAVARKLFYDRLLADFAEHPRTVVLSTHLVDEVGDLIDHVLLLHKGRLTLDRDADALRGHAVTLTGPAETVERLTAHHDELHRDRIGATARITVSGLDNQGWARARGLGLDITPLSLQRFVVHLTGGQPAALDKESS